MSWTAWGTGGADGSGYFGVKSRQSDCADGGLIEFPAMIHAANPAPLPSSVGCGPKPVVASVSHGTAATTGERSAVVYIPGRLMWSDPDLHASVDPHQGAVGEAGGWAGEEQSRAYDLLRGTRSAQRVRGLLPLLGRPRLRDVG
jgi:hypothetical protein